MKWSPPPPDPLRVIGHANWFNVAWGPVRSGILPPGIQEGPFDVATFGKSERNSDLGRNFQVIYEQANAHGQKVQTAGSNMANTDSAVGSSWA